MVDAKTQYTWVSGKLIGEKTGETVTRYLYSDNEMIGFVRGGVAYWYLKNLQGDVTKVVDASGAIVASYVYDAWGAIISQSGSLADVNPIRYRGYYYDVESGLYYLQSRYYNPGWGRFLNADALFDTRTGVLGTNMYAYCENNAIMKFDPTGYIVYPLPNLLASLAVAKVNYGKNKKNNPKGFIYDQTKLSNMRYGLGKMNKNGCELVAIYNALMLLGTKQPSLADIAYACEFNGVQMGWGVWGGDPKWLGSYFKKHKMDNTKYTAQKSLENALKSYLDYTPDQKDKTMILSFWNKKGNVTKGLHTVAVKVKKRYIEHNRWKEYYLEYYAYNWSSKDTTFASKRDSISELIDDGKFICAYIFK
jgi:RHS repeat-associated protein